MRNSPNFSLADEVIVRALEAGAFPSACLLVGRDERVLYRRAYGRLSIEDDAPLTNEHTRYDLASVTKPLVVGMLTLRAMEAGKLCLWDRLGTFLDAPPDKRDITIAQILTHTAGFPTGLHLWELSDQPENSAETILNAPLVSPPGARVRYCCAGFILLGQLLECLYGMGLNELAMKEVFWPLKMRDTGYLPQDGNIAATEMQDDGRCLQGVVHDENARFLGGVAGNAGQANYAASKAGVIGLTKSIARELAARNVTANAVAPGFIATDMTDALSEKQREAILGRIASKRLGDPEDVAKLVRFLASEEAGYITGQVICIDGGMSL